MIDTFPIARERIRSSLPEHDRGADYDRIAGGYDLLVGNGFYNRLVWGCAKS
jgi:hypothetical protein